MYKRQVIYFETTLKILLYSCHQTVSISFIFSGITAAKLLVSVRSLARLNSSQSPPINAEIFQFQIRKAFPVSCSQKRVSFVALAPSLIKGNIDRPSMGVVLNPLTVSG